jgi:hypothetical protein
MFNQPPIYAMLTLTERHDLQPDQIESVLVEMNDFETSYPSARFSGSHFARRAGTGRTAFVVAAACVNRGFVLPPDRPPGWSSPVEGIDRLPTHAASLQLAERVTVVGSPEIGSLAPRLTVRLNDGTVHSIQLTGDELKLNVAQDRAVIRALVPEVPGGAGQVERLIAAVTNLDDSPSVTDLIAAAIHGPLP